MDDELCSMASTSMTRARAAAWLGRMTEEQGSAVQRGRERRGAGQATQSIRLQTNFDFRVKARKGQAAPSLRVEPAGLVYAID